MGANTTPDGDTKKLGYDSKKHHRKSIRLKGYDYSKAGAYFITICTQNRECILGKIIDQSLVLNDAGMMVEKWWMELNKKYPEIMTDEFVIMPNHFHGIIQIMNPTDSTCAHPNNHIVGADLRVCPNDQGGHTGPPLHGVIQWFKTMTTNEYIRNVKESGWKPFPGKLWQRNFYEHIIRNDRRLNTIRKYIKNNPFHWEFDIENPNEKPIEEKKAFWKTFLS